MSTSLVLGPKRCAIWHIDSLFARFGGDFSNSVEGNQCTLHYAVPIDGNQLLQVYINCIADEATANHIPSATFGVQEELITS